MVNQCVWGKGIIDAVEAGKFLEANSLLPNQIVSSPLKRAFETAKIASRSNTISIDPYFREIEDHYEPDDVATITFESHFDWKHGCQSDQNVYAHAFQKISSSITLLFGHSYSFQCIAREFGWDYNFRCCMLDNGAIVEFYIVRTPFGVFGLMPKILFKNTGSDCHRFC